MGGEDGTFSSSEDYSLLDELVPFSRYASIALETSSLSNGCSLIVVLSFFLYSHFFFFKGRYLKIFFRHCCMATFSISAISMRPPSSRTLNSS